MGYIYILLGFEFYLRKQKKRKKNCLFVPIQRAIKMKDTVSGNYQGQSGSKRPALFPDSRRSFGDTEEHIHQNYPTCV